MKVLIETTEGLKAVEVDGDDKYFWTTNPAHVGECRYLNLTKNFDYNKEDLGSNLINGFFNNFLKYAIDEDGIIFGWGLTQSGVLVDAKWGMWKPIKTKLKGEFWLKKGTSVKNFKDTIYGLCPWTEDYLLNEYIPNLKENFHIHEMQCSREDVLCIGGELTIVRVGLLSKFSTESYKVIATNTNTNTNMNTYTNNIDGGGDDGDDDDNVLVAVQNGYKIITPDGYQRELYCVK